MPRRRDDSARAKIVAAAPEPGYADVKNATNSGLCGVSWPWTPGTRPAKWAGHVCGLQPGHSTRHSCLAKACRSWHTTTT